MEFPKLRPRPEAKMVCTAFRGLDRRPGASNRSYNKSWQWGWHDERNLSSDRYPRLSVRKGRGPATIDNNAPENPIIGMCGGDNALLLDSSGTLHCNGNRIYLAGEGGQYYSWSTEPGRNEFSVTPSSGNTGADPVSDNIQGELWDAWQGHYGAATLEYDLERTPDRSAPWHCLELDTWTRLSDLGLTADRDPVPGDSFTVTFRVSSIFGDRPQIVRMGAYAIIYPHWTWVNAVKLGAGDELVEGEDYGPCAGQLYADGDDLTLSLCDIDGNAFNGVVAQSTEPLDQEGYWLDTSQDKPVLREWNYIQQTWVSVVYTFVKIETFRHEPLLDTIRRGDGVTISAECSTGTDPGVVELLNKEHFIYGAEIDEEDGGWIMVAGILPAATVTVSLEEDGAGLVKRTMPELDFLVEAQNRLWGCRYSEADNLNEIYASKLGDFKNWHVFQGLSTDSWTASRGTPAPFTGAAVLDGCPLFFRAESLEKVFPSAYGGHQISIQSLEGVQQGSDRSMVIIDKRLYYKSRLGVCVYSGSLPARISEEFGDWTFRSASAARHRKKYVICMTRNAAAGRGGQKPERLVMVYDTETGDWHPEDEPWDGIAVTWDDVCYYVRGGEVYAYDYGTTPSEVQWYAESDEMSLELPEHKWIKTLRLRYQLENGASCRVYMSYDGGPWERKMDLHGNRLHSAEAEIWPRRCDHFRLRLEGKSGFELQSISYRVERSQGGR